MLFLFLACTGNKVSESDPSAETDTGTTPVMVNGIQQYSDYQTQAAIEGATVVDGSQTVTTDAAGLATLQYPAGKAYETVATAEGYPDHHNFGIAEMQDFQNSHFWPTTKVISSLSRLLKLDEDPTRGIVVISIVAGDGYVAGATADLGAAYDVALVPDPSSGSGLSPGNTTLDGAYSWVIFFNTTAGEVQPTVTPPSGFSSCVEDPNGGGVTLNPKAYGGGFTAFDYHCS